MGGVGELLLVALIVFLAIPAPLFIILYFVTKWKKSRELSGGDEQLMEDMWALAQRFEDRLDALETILDNEMPGWRRQR